MGMFVWLELPPGFDAVERLRGVVEQERVAYSPGQAFAVQRTSPPWCGGATQSARNCSPGLTS